MLQRGRHAPALHIVRGAHVCRLWPPLLVGLLLLHKRRVRRTALLTRPLLQLLCYVLLLGPRLQP